MRKPHDVNRIVIQKIIGYCNDIEFTLNRFGNSFDSYVSDINCRYSCDMCVLQIGELTKRLTDDFKTEHPEIIWREIKAKAIPIAKKYGVKRLSLFGSYARGEADAQSDLDFLYDKINSKGMFAYFGFVQDMEDEFKCHIDLVSDGISDKKFLSEVKQDEVLLYEESA